MLRSKLSSRRRQTKPSPALSVHVHDIRSCDEVSVTVSRVVVATSARQSRNYTKPLQAAFIPKRRALSVVAKMRMSGGRWWYGRPGKYGAAHGVWNECRMPPKRAQVQVTESPRIMRPGAAALPPRTWTHQLMGLRLRSFSSMRSQADSRRRAPRPRRHRANPHHLASMPSPSPEVGAKLASLPAAPSPRSFRARRRCAWPRHISKNPLPMPLQARRSSGVYMRH